MEKIYSELQSTKTEMQQGFKRVDERFDKVENDIKKIDIKLEEFDKKADLSLEGHKTNTEQLNRIESEVSRHEEFILKRVK